MDRCSGSAAVAARVASMPQSAVAEYVTHCAERLAHAARLAASAARGAEPLHGAEYLVDTVDDVSADLRLLRALLRARRFSRS
jgi:hypothetical protein